MMPGRSIADAYVVYMEAKVDYFERQSKALFGREIPQVLLVHANRLNAQHFDRIAAMLERRGYRFVPLETALEDKAYRSPDTFTGRGGITWLHRWALSRDPRGEIVKNEPRTPGVGHGRGRSRVGVSRACTTVPRDTHFPGTASFHRTGKRREIKTIQEHGLFRLPAGPRAGAFSSRDVRPSGPIGDLRPRPAPRAATPSRPRSRPPTFRKTRRPGRTTVSSRSTKRSWKWRSGVR